jgi:hypothetical protein
MGGGEQGREKVRQKREGREGKGDNKKGGNRTIFKRVSKSDLDISGRKSSSYNQLYSIIIIQTST